MGILAVDLVKAFTLKASWVHDGQVCERFVRVVVGGRLAVWVGWEDLGESVSHFYFAVDARVEMSLIRIKTAISHRTSGSR